MLHRSGWTDVGFMASERKLDDGRTLRCRAVSGGQWAWALLDSVGLKIAGGTRGTILQAQRDAEVAAGLEAARHA